MFDFRGTPAEIGKAYGGKCRNGILANLKVLVHKGSVHREGHSPLPRQDADFRNWIHRQEDLLEKHWPWMLGEMAGVAEGSGATYEDILLLNLRAWQYKYYGLPPLGGCSSLAVTLADGSKACAGTLDDPAEYYCGPVRFVPDNGYRFITFPITGTSWANRGMNCRGLAVGVSSQLLPGLRLLPHTLNQDLALRIILQTCATAGEVQEFCRAFPFTMNLVCVDVQGDIFGAHHTAAGLFEISATQGWCALTNHVSDDAVLHKLSGLGVKEFPESNTTRARRGKLVAFCRKRNGFCTTEEVMDLIGQRDDGDPGSIHNRNTIHLTYASPQVDSHTLRVMQPLERSGRADFEALAI